MHDDPDTHYHLTRVQQEVASATRSGSVLTASIHADLALRHLAHALTAAARTRRARWAEERAG